MVGRMLLGCLKERTNGVGGAVAGVVIEGSGGRLHVAIWQGVGTSRQERGRSIERRERAPENRTGGRS